MRKETKLKKIVEQREKKKQLIEIEKKRYQVQKDILESKVQSSKIRYRQAEKFKKQFDQRVAKIREKGNIKIHEIKHPFSITTKTKEYNIKSGFEEHFELRKPYNKNLQKFLTKSRNEVRYILVTVKVKSATSFDDEESEEENEKTIPILVTRTYTPESLKTLNDNVLNDIVNQFILKNSKESFISEKYKILGVYIRVIYENTKTNKTKKRKNRGNKK